MFIIVKCTVLATLTKDNLLLNKYAILKQMLQMKLQHKEELDELTTKCE